MKYYKSSLLVLNLLAATSTFATVHNMTISGTIPAIVKLNQQNLTATDSATKQISLERVTLTPAAYKNLAAKLEFAQKIKPTLSSLDSGNVGMGSVPVLDQGQHGTCVTFAISAAVDAAYNSTNYISQLCNLELGSYLHNQNSNYDSGWDGSYPTEVLQQMAKYGIISMQYQTTNGCGNKNKTVKRYPTNNPNNTGVPMSDNDFVSHSEPVMQSVAWKELLTDEDSTNKTADMDAVLANVKQAITNGHRVTFATLLDVYGSLEFYNGAMGKFNGIAYDTWTLTKQITDDINHDAQNPQNPRINAGHAMVIIGYDDNAVVTDTDNKQHTGVLTLRNSWGASAGDRGNYYMTYDFFKALVMDAQEIIPA